jgi:hypothetical protein
MLEAVVAGAVGGSGEGGEGGDEDDTRRHRTLTAKLSGRRWMDGSGRDEEMGINTSSRRRDMYLAA